MFKEYKDLMLGDISIPTYLALFTFSFLAIALSIYAHSKSSYKKTDRTPEAFSWGFMIWDNMKRFASGMIVMFLLYRFAFDWLSDNVSMQLAVGIGFFVSMGIDRVILFISKKTNFFNMPEIK